MAASPEKHKHWNEMVGLLLSALGLLLFLSLVSYSATDPCFSVSGDGAEVKNYIGIIGAFLSDALLQIVGLSAFVIPLYLFAYAAFLVFGGEARHPHLKKVGGIMLFVSASAFFGLQGEVIVLFGEALPSGGMLGSSIAYLLLTGFSATGAYIITLTASVLALMLLTPFSPLKALAWLRTAFDRFAAQLDLLITVYQGRKEKAKEAKRRPRNAQGPPQDR